VRLTVAADPMSFDLSAWEPGKTRGRFVCLRISLPAFPRRGNLGHRPLSSHSVKHFVDEQDRNADRKAQEIYTHDFGGAVFLEAIAARYHQSQ
jgi:hypothetical protein